MLGWIGFPFAGSKVEVCLAGYSAPDRPSDCGVEIRLMLPCTEGVSSLFMPACGVGDGLDLVFRSFNLDPGRRFFCL